MRIPSYNLSRHRAVDSMATGVGSLTLAPIILLCWNRMSLYELYKKRYVAPGSIKTQVGCCP